MEWVETTGRTVDEAKEAALDELGVDEADAEFEVVADAQTGLFGRLRSEARVRARVKPTAPRAKEDRRDRRRRTGSPGAKKPNGAESVPAAPASVATEPGGEEDARPAPVPTAEAGEAPEKEADGPPTRGPARNGRSGRGRGERRDRSPGPAQSRQDDDADEFDTKGADVEVALEDQARVAEDFLAQLTAEFGLNASVATVRTDEDTIELQLSGSDLGILIGPKGATLVALQNLARTVVHHETGANNGHLNVDVGGYRQKRTEALVNFARQVAARVQESGTRAALEPMSAVDRKIVHDTIGDIDGVTTISEGEDPNRRVVVLPAAG